MTISNAEYTRFVIAMDKCPRDHTLTHALSGLAGECGEVNELYTKAVRKGEEVDPLRMKDELGDCLWFVTRLAAHCGYDLDDLIEHNVHKLQERYKV